MMHKTGCLICGESLVYTQEEKQTTCSVCGKRFMSNVMCEQGHFVCDECHQSDAYDYIERYCLNSNETDPGVLINSMMKSPMIKMHGPEHHFMVPAVLLTAYYNKTNQHKILHEKLKTARKRSSVILGGFCGFYGSCGAGIGTGIFLSIIQNATPLSGDEWKYGNMLTANSLTQIAQHGGPRCCKRDSFVAIQETVKFLKEHFNAELPLSSIQCGFSELNKECKLAACPFFVHK